MVDLLGLHRSPLRLRPSSADSCSMLEFQDLDDVVNFLGLLRRVGGGCSVLELQNFHKMVDPLAEPGSSGVLEREYLHHMVNLLFVRAHLADLLDEVNVTDGCSMLELQNLHKVVHLLRSPML